MKTTLNVKYKNCISFEHIYLRSRYTISMNRRTVLVFNLYIYVLGIQYLMNIKGTMNVKYKNCISFEPIYLRSRYTISHEYLLKGILVFTKGFYICNIKHDNMSYSLIMATMILCLFQADQ